MIAFQLARRVPRVRESPSPAPPSPALALSGPALADSPAPARSSSATRTSPSAPRSTFWGAQWWKDNPLSTGSAPASFKGYADNAATCGQTWTTRPGNSSDPPASLSATINVIVLGPDRQARSGDLR